MTRWEPGEAEKRAGEAAETLARIREIAARNVPDWEPQMTAERGYAGVLRHKKWQPGGGEGA